MVHNYFNLVHYKLDSYLPPYQYLRQQHNSNIDTLIVKVNTIKISQDELLAKYNILKADYDKLKTLSPTTDSIQDIHLQSITFIIYLCKTLNICVTTMHNLLLRIYHCQNPDDFKPVYFITVFFETLGSYPNKSIDTYRYQSYKVNLNLHLELNNHLIFKEIEDLIPSCFYIGGKKDQPLFRIKISKNSYKPK